jgi:hypothetical protein
MTRDARSSRLSRIVAQWEADSWAARMYIFDLLAAAWGWSLDEQAAVARRTPAELAGYREHRAKPDALFVDLVMRLERLQFSIWMSQPREHYAAWWRRSWRRASPIGEMTPLAALIDDSEALHALQRHFDAMLSGDFS